MRLKVRSPQDHAALVQRMAQAGYKRPYDLIVEEPGHRTLEQNSLLWALLTDVSRQVEWYGEHLSPEAWKDVLTAAQHAQRAVPGIDGGVVMLGHRTSKMNKAQLSELVELIYAFGADHDVIFTEPKIEENE